MQTRSFTTMTQNLLRGFARVSACALLLFGNLALVAPIHAQEAAPAAAVGEAAAEGLHAIIEGL